MFKTKFFSITVTTDGDDGFNVDVKLSPVFASVVKQQPNVRIDAFLIAVNKEISRQLKRTIAKQGKLTAPAPLTPPKGGRYAWMKPGAKCRYSFFNDEVNDFQTLNAEVISEQLGKTTRGQRCVQLRNELGVEVWVLCSNVERGTNG